MKPQHISKAFGSPVRRFALLALCSLSLTATARSRDLGQWENTDPTIRSWYQALMMPDVPTASCCGEADAYWCDDIHVRNGKTFCTITDDRDNIKLRRTPVPVGTEIEIPDNKLTTRFEPTGSRYYVA